MIKAIAILIDFSEHPDHQQPKRFSGEDCWEQAQTYLTHLAFLCPTDLLGYYKTDFEIEWENGETYKGRLDLTHPDSQASDHNLASHVHTFALHYSGRKCPPRFTAKQYHTILDHYSVTELAYYADVLDNYDLNGLTSPP